MTAMPPGLDAETALASRLLDGFRALSADVEGVTRPAYSPVETACIELVAQAGAAQGLVPHWDGVGNLWLAPEGLGGAPAAACGSHMDSVPRGGDFDGTAGVVAGLLCAVRAMREGWPLRALVLRGEESPWFGAPHVGARAGFGAIGPAELATTRRDSGRTLAEHMAEVGGDPALAGGGRPLPEVARTVALYELHIEQGPELVHHGQAAAAVSSVRGHVRWPRAACVGAAGHSGTVPRHLRQDPAMAVAELLHGLDTLWARTMQEGTDLVVTAGMLCIDPAQASPTRIPDRVSFSLDIRSSQADTLAAMRRTVAQETAKIGRARGVRFDLGPEVGTAPVVLDAAGRDAIERELPGSRTMASGAGHDAAEFARRGVPGAMVFVRNRHGSHNPAEAMDVADLMAGVNALHGALRSRFG